MSDYRVTFEYVDPVLVPSGALLTEAAVRAGVQIAQPCGGQGRCGRCAVRVQNGGVRRRSTLRLSAEDVAQGFALACQTVVEGDVLVTVPEQEVLDRHLTTDRVAAEVQPPPDYDPQRDQSLRRLCLTLSPPSMDDQRDDWSRLQTAVRQQIDGAALQISLPLLRKIGGILRAGEWQVTAVLHAEATSTQSESSQSPVHTLVDLQPGHAAADAPLYGLAIDIGTTTVTVWLVDLLSGRVVAQAAEYNRQIQRGEDVISRVIYASKNSGQGELRTLVVQSLNNLIERVGQKTGNSQRPETEGSHSPLTNPRIYKAVIAGNSIMMHLLLGIPADSIRLAPFVTAVNHLPLFTAQEIGLDIHPEAPVICLPGIASYVGADITAGVLSSGLDDADDTALFLDIGTNGEMVLGGRDWLVTCACSAGPAFEGAGVRDGMRATRGAIEEVWIDGRTYEPSLRIIGNAQPRGICGSGLISLLAELFLTGVIDRGGNFAAHLATNRIRQGENGLEYVLAWPNEAWHGQAIAITRTDIDNLLRAKAAIYAGMQVLADSVGVPLALASQVLIGGAFGKYINVEKAIQIGLLPDKPWEQFRFLGNTAVLGAYAALLSQAARQRIDDIARRMTYIELSADNSFYDAFTSALFLPHTDMGFFPSVAQALTGE